MEDFNRCVNAVYSLQAKNGDVISDSLVRALVVAEDHRNDLHFGVDPLAIIRALKVRLVEGKRQGASTVEQQFVRVVTERFEKTPRRKLREQILAVMISSAFSKGELARSYLKVAYYGASLVGVRGVERLKFGSFPASDTAIIAYLKYPKISDPDGVVAANHLIRVKHINNLLSDKKFTSYLVGGGLV